MNLMNTDPLDRMNYFNGQRLEAEDFRLEQDYHIRVRRLLNSSLFTYGIAAGLEVSVKADDPHRVVVNPGLALDLFGREIVVLEPVELLVTGLPSPVEGVALGNYLTIRYSEAPADRTQDGCRLSEAGGQRLTWGGPTRLRAGAVLEWQNSWPGEGSDRIVLIQAELDDTCAVRDLRAGVRRYVGSPQPRRAMAYALEGAYNIDAANPKLLYFHIRGGRPEAVTLYLHGAMFSSLYYTELGLHDHGLQVDLEKHENLGDHTHKLKELTTTSAGSHDHRVKADTRQDALGLELSDPNSFETSLTNKVNMIVVEAGDHPHTIPAGEITDPSTDMDDLGHNFIQADVGKTGASTAARTPVGEFKYEAYTYPKDLQVWLDDTEVTGEILNRLGWTELGDGFGNHLLVTKGTGPIQIDLLGKDMSEGEHCIELRLLTGGGQVLYNLYVE